ncbi:hypothetical protein ACFL67_02270 [candidate division KSB1 bacterium]
MCNRVNPLLLLLVIFLFLPISVFSQGQYELQNRSLIGVRIGYYSQGSSTEDAVTNYVSNSATTTNLATAIQYGKWIQENLSVHFSVSALMGDAENTVGISGVSNHAYAISSFYLGMKYYLPESRLGSPVRPYLSAFVGPNLAFEAKNTVNSQVVNNARTQTALGGKFGGGLDIILSRRLLATADAGYNLVTDFSEPVVGRKNYSGFEFTIGIGFLFGGR